jgi:hypothetical protein
MTHHIFVLSRSNLDPNSAFNWVVSQTTQLLYSNKHSTGQRYHLDPRIKNSLRETAGNHFLPTLSTTKPSLLPTAALST